MYLTLLMEFWDFASEPCETGTSPPAGQLLLSCLKGQSDGADSSRCLQGSACTRSLQIFLDSEGKATLEILR